MGRASIVGAGCARSYSQGGLECDACSMGCSTVSTYFDALCLNCRWTLRSLTCAERQDLGLDWRLGAATFESLLVDHDWSVNTANWAYFAGGPNNSSLATCRLHTPTDCGKHLWANANANHVPE